MKGGGVGHVGYQVQAQPGSGPGFGRLANRFVASSGPDRAAEVVVDRGAVAEREYPLTDRQRLRLVQAEIRSVSST